MIDALFKFASETTAKADPVIGKLWFPGDSESPAGWTGNLIPNVLVWDQRQDVQGTDADGNPTVTHTYDTSGWFCILSAFVLADDIANHANAVLITDRDKAKAGQPFILHTTLTADQLTYSRLSPIDAGADYPFGSPPQ